MRETNTTGTFDRVTNLSLNSQNSINANYTNTPACHIGEIGISKTSKNEKIPSALAEHTFVASTGNTPSIVLGSLCHQAPNSKVPT
jgi:hypothetical protein